MFLHKDMSFVSVWNLPSSSFLPYDFTEVLLTSSFWNLNIYCGITWTNELQSIRVFEPHIWPSPLSPLLEMSPLFGPCLVKSCFTVAAPRGPTRFLRSLGSWRGSIDALRSKTSYQWEVNHGNSKSLKPEPQFSNEPPILSNSIGKVKPRHFVRRVKTWMKPSSRWNLQFHHWQHKGHCQALSQRMFVVHWPMFTLRLGSLSNQAPKTFKDYAKLC